MPKTMMVVSLLFLGFSLSAQTSFDKITGEIERNSTTLAAIRKGVDADKIGSKTSIFLDNPDFEFHYLWGTPSSLDNRMDFYVTQTFDFPSVYVYKSQMADSKIKQFDIGYQRYRISLISQVRSILLDLVYCNAQERLFEKRMSQALALAAAYQNKLKAGEANILEYNKAQLNLLNLRKEAENNGIQRDALLNELMRNNGGVPVDFRDTVFTYTEIPADFDTWYKQYAQQVPELNLIRNEIEVSEKQEQLSFAQTLPKFSAGYMSENNSFAKLRGITAGISIPLFENKNSVKYARAQTTALRSMETDRNLQVYNQLKIYHRKAIELQKAVADYRTSLSSFDNTRFLDKALEKGEITLTDYILELSIYYSSLSNLLETEKEMNRAVIELYQFVL